MRQFHPWCAFALLAALAPGLGACASMQDHGLGDIKVPRAEMFNDAFSFSNRREDFSMPEPSQNDLIGAGGECAAVQSADSGGGVGIALQMTECDVVRRAGAPDKIEFPSNNSYRAVVLTYLRGPRPGIYTFYSGRLVTIDRAAEPPPPPKPARKGRA